MEIFGDPKEFRKSGAVIAIGMFDGVHGGHQRVLRRLRELGLRHQRPTLVLTLDPHPRALLSPQTAPKMLCSLADRMNLLAATGLVDHCLVLPFDRDRSHESAEDFVRGTLVAHLGMRALVIGENFACGHGRRGNVDLLRELGTNSGFDVHPMPLRSECDPTDEPHFSSTEARRLIQDGNLQRAAVLLGRPHQLICRIVAGARESAQARVADLPDEMCAPPAGVYLGDVRNEERDSAWIPAALLLRETHSPTRRTVRFVADARLGFAAGDRVRLRFSSNASLSS